MRVLILLLAMTAFVIASCGRGNKDKSQDETEAASENTSGTSDNPAEAMAEAMKSLSGGDGKVADPVDHRKLMEMLKENVDGYTRKDYSSQSAGTMGFNMSNAEANYENGDKRIQANIIDAAGAGMAFMSLAAWSNMQLDREDSNGWERTSTWKGYKSFEKYTKSNNSSELNLIVENRFIVTLNGYNVGMDDLKDFADELDLGHLKSLI